MGASKKRQMKYLATDWADQIWLAAKARNSGKGAAWLLPLAAIALTGARPAALEKGIVFSIAQEGNKYYVQALVQGVKITATRSQPWHQIRWSLNPEQDDSITHRKKELALIARALLDAPGRTLHIRYDAEGISTRLREISKKLWPKKKYHVSAYSYRELFSSAAKSAGVGAEELAIAMGHISAESQGRYAGRSQKSTGSVAPPPKPWATVSAPEPIKMERAPMARFKAASARKRAMEVFAEKGANL